MNVLLKNKMKNLLLILLWQFFAISNSLNILNLNGCGSPSHHVWNMAIVHRLAKLGYNVTVLSPDIDSNPPENVHHIHLESVYDFMYNVSKFDLVSLHNESGIDSVVTLKEFGSASCLGVIHSTKGLQQMLNYPNDFKFDLILYDFTVGPCLLGFLHKFNYPPVVGITAFNNPTYTIEIMGGHNYYAYIPYFALNYDSNMNFWQRLNNIYIHAYDYYLRNYVLLPSIDKMVRPIFGNHLPYMGDLEFKTVVALVNSHPVIDFPEPLPPNIIPVAGLQARDPKPLPENLEKFIQKSKKGVILFSLGTNIRSDRLGAHKQQILLDAFGQLTDYHFLWKFETNTLPSKLPKNVVIQKWMPQNDILGHKKCKAFITHSGALSTQEATWHGVPMIAIPFFVDQIRNSYKSVIAGVAERILFQELTTELVVEKVRKVLEDPSYQTNMKIRSDRFRDQPEKPLDRAIWWIEYVIRNPNPEHLRSPVLKHGPFISNCYDIILFFFVIITILIIAVNNVINVIKKYRRTTNKKKIQ